MEESKNSNLIKLQFRRKVTRSDIRQVYDRAEELFRKVKSGFLDKEYAKIKLLVMMIKDYWNEVYKEVPIHTIAAIVVALLYILNSIDLVPDFIPVAGQADDLMVLYFAWRMISEDVKEYADWKIKQGDVSVQTLIKEAFEKTV